MYKKAMSLRFMDIINTSWCHCRHLVESYKKWQIKHSFDGCVLLTLILSEISIIP